ncbi:proteasome-associated ATPase-like [Culex quinquefasciatus]|uniref:proteasome-associated ATPase-like n=1 Tax=Culex quinquefasciatus TaxID=7176 RepID=UPI0018E2B50E|nr:proteasome-associated ATPase-like [Culex quinquefasciatus]
MEVDEWPTEHYSDIGGLDKQIQELIEAVVLPMTHKDMFKNLGIHPLKGVLHAFVKFLSHGAEKALNQALTDHSSIAHDVKSALRDIGCKVYLEEAWTAHSVIQNEEDSEDIGAFPKAKGPKASKPHLKN